MKLQTTTYKFLNNQHYTRFLIEKIKLFSINLIILFCCFMLFLINPVFSQTFLNTEWTRTFASPVVSEYFNSVADVNGNIYTVGNNYSASQGSNILISKHDRRGDLIWIHNLNYQNNSDDIGTNVYLSNEHVYICGFSYNLQNQTNKVLIYKLDFDGNILLNILFSSANTQRDVPVALTTDANNNIFTLMASEQSASNIDFLLAKHDDSGNLLWEQRYDYAGLNEYPLNIQMPDSNTIAIAGASASNNLNWDYTVCYYDLNGNLQNEVRNNLPGFGLDLPKDFTKDQNGNLYITGRGFVNGQNYQAQTIKINNQNQIEWVRNYENLNFMESCGNAISINNSGHIVVGGYVKDFNNDKYFLTIKYDANGEEIWTKIGAGVLQKNEEIKDLKIKENNALYILKTKETGLNLKIINLSKLNNDGNLIWTKNITQAENLSGFNLNIINNDIYVSSVRDGQIKSYIIYKTSEHQTSAQVISNAQEQPVMKKNELIVRFTKNAVDTNAVNDFDLGDRKIIFNDLSYWLLPDAMQAINQKFERFCSNGSPNNKCNLMGIKVFPNLKTNLRRTENRLGQIIDVPDFYRTFIVEFPENINIGQAKDSLEKLKQYVAYAEPNYILKQHNDTLSNDAFFTNQTSLMPYEPVAEEVRPDINIEQAWRIFPQAGKPFVKVGVFDSGINYNHLDFGGPILNGNTSNSVIKGGWSFYYNNIILDLTPNDYINHGTPVTGIIGAKRNNYIGIAGIAGGNYDNASGNQSQGVSLYDMQLAILNTPGFQGPYMGTVNYLYNGLVESTILDSDYPFRFGLNLQNLSSGASVFFGGLGAYNALTDTNIVLLNEACRFVNKQNVVLVASRGNGEYQQPFNENLNTNILPATTYDPWVISVGASGRNGRISHQQKIYLANGDSLMPNSMGTSRFGSGMDLIAPGNPQEIFSTDAYGYYGQFSGTSAAAPHVSGVVAMMMSYYNQPGNNYNNLAPEDCEKIIELSCSKAPDSSFYAAFEASGRLNAGKAMQLMQQPAAKILHCNNIIFNDYLTIADSTNLYEITLTEPYQNLDTVWFSRGNYKVKKYRVNSLINHSMGINDSILNYWPRSSGTNLLAELEETNNTVRENIYIDTLNIQLARIHGFVYQVFDTLNTPLGWWPFKVYSTNRIKFEYSILVRDTTIQDLTSIENSPENVFKVYPNPTNNFIFIESEYPITNVEIFNNLGSKINAALIRQASNKIQIDLGENSNGLYLVRISEINGNISNTKLLKK